MQSIFHFTPIYKERPWGGQKITTLGRLLEPGKKIGESWEIADLPESESVISRGIWKGQSLRWLLEEHGTEIMGRPWSRSRRFPLLVKILDAKERLSLQVHPPADKCHTQGELPKTELWYLLSAASEASIIAGFKPGVSRERFERVLKMISKGDDPAGLAAHMDQMLHRILVKADSAMFIPAGRLHAIDAGCLILEIQSSSDTTFRAYDWGRVGLDGKPRTLHLEQTFESTHIDDVEPACVSVDPSAASQVLGSCEHFKVELLQLKQPTTLNYNGPAILSVVKGKARITGPYRERELLHCAETVLLGCHSFQIEAEETPAKVLMSSRF
jgi:mannose-6-phosphate isomerase